MADVDIERIDQIDGPIENPRRTSRRRSSTKSVKFPANADAAAPRPQFPSKAVVTPLVDGTHHLSAKRRVSKYRNFPHNVPNIEELSPVKGRRKSMKIRKRSSKATHEITMLKVTEDQELG